MLNAEIDLGLDLELDNIWIENRCVPLDPDRYCENIHKTKFNSFFE